MTSASAVARGARNAEYGAIFLALTALPIGLVIGVLFFHTRYIHQTQTVHVPTPKPIRSLADLERALGKPDGQTAQGCPGWRLGSTTVIACG